MGNAIPHQHPAVVLRSHYQSLQALLALAVVVLVGLSLALVVVATDDETATPAPSINQALAGRAGVATPDLAKPVQPIEYGDFNPQTGRPMDKVATPDESRIAAAISGAQQSRDQSGTGGPDESSVASAIGNSTGSPAGDPPVSQAQPGARP